MTVDLRIYTFKDGVLSRVAHDLQIVAHDVRVSAEGNGWQVTLDPHRLQVECAMRVGVPAPGVLSAKDKHDIEETLRSEVLHAGRHPLIRWSIGAIPHLPGVAQGRLQLHGQERPQPVELRVEAGTMHARAEIDQRSFGITPYKALMGALKVQPIVRIEAQLTWPWPG
jgi:polyisoprenoid-binding protein YceI